MDKPGAAAPDSIEWYEQQLDYQANHDILTNLPNRNLLLDRLRQLLLVYCGNPQQIAVFFVDLDNFKFINDSLGHEAGDVLLKTIAKRLSDCATSGDTVARLGGDEFVIVSFNTEASDHAASMAGIIQKAISRPLKISEHEIVITCSIGISVFPKDGNDAQTLMKNADTAMYRAKEIGRNNFQYYSDEMNVKALMRMTMEKHLRRALERDELILYYQPKVSLRTGRICGMEALVRWLSPDLGLVSPAAFIPLAEETGLIGEIGEWVLRSACSQNRAWQDAGLVPLTVAVNISAHQFRMHDLLDIINRILLETCLDPKYLELEITESVVMQNVEKVMGILNEIKGWGLSLALDDFGTGYSSLSYLKRFPFDKIKIDQSFVRDLTSNPHSAAIVKTVIAMSHSLRLEVIAEGVETIGELNYLRRHDCDEIQGYYFSRPVPAVEFEALLRSGRCLDLQDENKEKSVLVVDDEEGIRTSLKRMLVLDGYKVLTAASAVDGFELLANNRIGVVLSDQWMPVMNGSEFLFRAREIYPETVRILMSGRADIDTLTDAVNQGAIYKFLAKPWEENHVRNVIADAFRYWESIQSPSF